MWDLDSRTLREESASELRRLSSSPSVSTAAGLVDRDWASMLEEYRMPGSLVPTARARPP
jgi:hypothetical protein